MTQCKKCKLFISLTKDDVFKCKAGCEAVFHKKCVQNNKLFLQTAICDDCKKNVNMDPRLTINEDSNENILFQINKKLEVLYNVEKKIEDLSSNVEFYAEMYQTLMTFKEESQKKIKALEQRNIYLEKCNNALEERVQELELREKEKNIEIHGLEMEKNENTKVLIQDLALKLNLNPNDIKEAQRVGEKKSGDTKPKIILVKLSSKSARTDWMLAKKENKITNNKIYNNGNDKRIYINEDLPRHKRQLLWIVRNTLKPKGFQYIWVQNFNILVKKNCEEKRIYNIRSEKDLCQFEDSK